MCSAEFSLFAKSAEPLGFCSCCFNSGIGNAGQSVSYFSLFQVCGHRQSIEHWNCFKGDVGETSERRGGAHMGFSERIDTILN